MPDQRQVLDALDFVPRMLCDSCDDPAVGVVTIRCQHCRYVQAHVACRNCQVHVLGRITSWWKQGTLGCPGCQRHFRHHSTRLSDVLEWDALR